MVLNHVLGHYIVREGQMGRFSGSQVADSESQEVIVETRLYCFISFIHIQTSNHGYKFRNMESKAPDAHSMN